MVESVFERLEWDTGWTDSGRVFTQEHGAPLRAGHISEHLEVLISQAGRLHDLRHGSASMQLAAGVPMKVASQILGHSTVSFTMDVYATVLEELAEDAATKMGAFIPRRANNVPAEER